MSGNKQATPINQSIHHCRTTHPHPPASMFAYRENDGNSSECSDGSQHSQVSNDTYTDTDTDIEEERTTQQPLPHQRPLLGLVGSLGGSLGSGDSLGHIAPLHQRRTVVQHDHIRTHHVVVHSRDRNLFREHLFRFQVLFGAVNQACDAPDPCKKKNKCSGRC